MAACLKLSTFTMKTVLITLVFTVFTVAYFKQKIDLIADNCKSAEAEKNGSWLNFVKKMMTGWASLWSSEPQQEGLEDGPLLSASSTRGSPALPSCQSSFIQNLAHIVRVSLLEDMSHLWAACYGLLVSWADTLQGCGPGVSAACQNSLQFCVDAAVSCLHFVQTGVGSFSRWLMELFRQAGLFQTPDGYFLSSIVAALLVCGGSCFVLVRLWSFFFKRKKRYNTHREGKAKQDEVNGRFFHHSNSDWSETEDFDCTLYSDKTPSYEFGQQPGMGRFTSPDDPTRDTGQQLARICSGQITRLDPMWNEVKRSLDARHQPGPACGHCQLDSAGPCPGSGQSQRWLSPGTVKLVLYSALTLLALSVPWEFCRLYQQAVANRVAVASAGAPVECAVGTLTLLQTLTVWLSRQLAWSHEHSCDRYYHAIYVDPLWDITPFMVLVSVCARCLVHPAELVSAGLGRSLRTFLAHVPLHWQPVCLLLGLALTLAALLMTCSYRLHIPLLLRIEPRTPVRVLGDRKGRPGEGDDPPSVQDRHPSRLYLQGRRLPDVTSPRPPCDVGARQGSRDNLVSPGREVTSPSARRDVRGRHALLDTPVSREKIVMSDSDDSPEWLPRGRGQKLAKKTVTPKRQQRQSPARKNMKEDGLSGL